MKTTRRVSVRKVAAMIVETVVDGMKHLPVGEQERRLQAFCDDAEKAMQKNPSSSAEAQLRPQERVRGSSPRTGAIGRYLE